MKHTKDNKLVLIKMKTKNGNTNDYFTSYSSAGLFLGIASQSVKWAINHHNELTTKDGLKVIIELVDGDDIPYKYINE